MKKRFLFSAMLSLALVAVSCGGDDEESEETFSTFTTEQHKQSIEKAGTDMLTQLDGIKNLSAIKTLTDLVNLGGGEEETSSTFALNGLIDNYTIIGKDASSILKLRSVTSSRKSLMDLFKEHTGTFSYNAETEEWDSTANSSKIVMKFPTSGSNVNNAEIILSDFTTAMPKHQIDLDEYDGQLIKSVSLTIKKNNSEVAKITLTGEYGSDDVPTKLTETLSFSEGYVMASTLTNNGKDITLNQSLKKSSTEILSTHFDSNGNFSYDNIDENVNSEEEDAFVNVINNANTWFTVGNIKIIGQIDVKSFMDKTDTDLDNSNKSEVNGAVLNLNKYATLYAKYTNDNTIIAKSSFFTESNEYGDWDYENHKYITTYYPGLKFVFSDNSSMDQSFFDTGFDTFLDQLEDLMSDMDENYQD